jgi:hypothetical protein
VNVTVYQLDRLGRQARTTDVNASKYPSFSERPLSSVVSLFTSFPYICGGATPHLVGARQAYLPIPSLLCD